MTTYVPNDLDWFIEGSLKRGFTDVLPIKEYESQFIKKTDIRVMIYNVSGAGAVSFTNINLANAFGKSSGINVHPTFATDEKLESLGHTASLDGYLTTDAAFEQGAEICILTGFLRNKDVHITQDAAYQTVANVFNKAKEHCPIVLAMCGSAEVAAYENHGMESTIYDQKNLGVFPFAKADAEIRDPSRKDYISSALNTLTHMPMSRSRNLSDAMLMSNDIIVQLYNHEAGVGIARERNNQTHYVLGHPENEDISLPLEQIRDWKNFAEGKIDKAPNDAKNILNNIHLENKFFAFKHECMKTREHNNNNPNDKKAAPEFDINTIRPFLENNWREGFAAYSNGIISQLFKMLQDGSAYDIAPKYKPAEGSGILVPDHVQQKWKQNQPQALEQA